MQHVRVLRGPNALAPHPVIAAEIEAVASSRGLASAWIRLREFLHHLASDGAEAQRADELGSAPAVEPEEIAIIVLNVARRLQVAAGSPPPRAETRGSRRSSTRLLWFEFEEEAVGVESVRQACALVDRWVQGYQPDVDEIVTDLSRTCADLRLGSSSAALVEVARRRGIPVRREPGDSLIQLGLGARMRRLQGPMTDGTSVIGVDIAQDKVRTKAFLRRFGFPTAPGRRASSAEDAGAFAREIGAPIVLKPLGGHSGRGVWGPVSDREAIVQAWARAREHSPEIMVERHAAGRDHRVLVIGGRLVAVAERRPPQVIGDGSSTIAQLVERVNREPRRSGGPPRVLAPVPLDELTTSFLAAHDWALDSIPEPGRRVVMRPTANLSTGGTSVDRTDEIHPRNAAECETLTQLVGLDIAGIDIITPDIGVPFRENGGVIIEVNASPGIRMHTDPAEGSARDAAGAILDLLYPEGSSPRIPIIAVARAAESSAIVRVVAAVLRTWGTGVGHLSDEGAFLDGARLTGGTADEAAHTELLLSHPRVEYAVLQISMEEILRAGLPFDRCQVAMIPEGVRPANPWRSYGADDPRVVLARGVAPTGMLVASRREPAPRPVGSSAKTGRYGLHPATPDTATAAIEAYMEGEDLVLRTAEGKYRLMHRSQIGPALEQLGVEPILGAIVAVAALGNPPSHIADALRGLGSLS